MLKRVAAVAGTVLMSGSLAAWALWPAATPAPTPSLSNPPLTSTAPVPVTPDFASMPEGLRPKLSPLDLDLRSEAAKAEQAPGWIAYKAHSTSWAGNSQPQLQAMRKHR